MKTNIHGITSILIAMSAWIIAIVLGFSNSVLVGNIGIIVTLVALMIVIRSYCSKCPGRNGHCSHHVFGKVARVFNDRCHLSYDKRDIVIVSTSLIIMLTTHLWMLIPHKTWMLIYLLLNSIAVGEILMHVCPNCLNRKCPLNRIK